LSAIGAPHGMRRSSGRSPPTASSSAAPCSHRCETRNPQGWPKLWANFKTLIGIFSQNSGPTYEFSWANPANFRFELGCATSAGPCAGATSTARRSTTTKACLNVCPASCTGQTCAWLPSRPEASARGQKPTAWLARVGQSADELRSVLDWRLCCYGALC
jgi:hypothetical protein